jgi:hypothetical protein
MRSASRLAPLLLLVAACQGEPPAGTTYYDRIIQPILTQSCSRGTSGCHDADPQDPFSFAAGNLDLTSFENVHKRPDVLRPYGAYPAPLLLLKAVGETDDLRIAYRGQSLPIRIPHAGGSVFRVSSSAFLTLQTWLENGATIDGQRPVPVPIAGSGACSTAVPADFDETSVTSMPEWAAQAGAFDGVQGVMAEKGCTAQNCHGAPQADFYVTCGDTERQKSFNFRQVWAFVSDPVDSSEILQRPIARGIPHSGGVHWQTSEDAGYQTIRGFAEAVGALEFGTGDAAKTFFADRVQPIFLQRGCASEACHNASSMNDFKLRAGTIGFFSSIALERNYDVARREFMAFESPDPRRGRLVAKNVFANHGGIAHRGGPLLEVGGADPSTCPQTYAPETSSMFCTFVEWSRIEREATGNPNGAGIVPLVYVERGVDDLASPLEFSTYQPGSDLFVRDLTVDSFGAIVSVGTPRSILGSCGAAADRGVVDVRAPDVKNDGRTVAFAMRTSAGEGLQIYTVDLDGTGCTRLTTPSGTVDNFDPAWSPDDGAWIVYSSSAVAGTTRRLSLPQSDIWRMHADGSNAERITFLSNSELGPQFIREGRMVMTTEKVDPRAPADGFYQLAGRRLNWDLTDYHPLLAQRQTSPVNPADPTVTLPSMGYAQATEIRENLNGDFLLVLSNPGARGGAGTLGTFNRSVGPFELGRTDPGFLVGVRIPDPGGLYRSPAPLLDGRVLVSYAGPGDPAAVTSLDWDLVAIDPATGARTTIAGGANAQVEGVLALRHPARKLYLNRRQLVFGGSQDTTDPGHAIVHFLDAPMLATLLGSNLRRGRFVEGFREADSLVFLDATGATIGSVPLAADGSARVRVPAGRPVVIGLRRGATDLFTMTEEHQFGPGENISLGVQEELYDSVCAGCHGSNSGRELDISIRPDALTGASQSLSAGATPTPVGP